MIGGIGLAATVLLGLMLVDYATGLMVAYKSKELNSRVGLFGLFRIDLLTFLKHSEKRILTLLPALQVRAFDLIKRAYSEGIPIQVTQARRTIEEQERLYAEGRSTPGNIVTWVRRSYHNYGLAFDIVLLTEDGTDCIWEDQPEYEAIGQIGKYLGLEWGGDW